MDASASGRLADHLSADGRRLGLDVRALLDDRRHRHRECPGHRDLPAHRDLPGHHACRQSRRPSSRRFQQSRCGRRCRRCPCGPRCHRRCHRWRSCRSLHCRCRLQSQPCLRCSSRRCPHSRSRRRCCSERRPIPCSGCRQLGVCPCLGCRPESPSYRFRRAAESPSKCRLFRSSARRLAMRSFPRWRSMDWIATQCRYHKLARPAP
jgi:hypothetical protein